MTTLILNNNLPRIKCNVEKIGLFIDVKNKDILEKEDANNIELNWYKKNIIRMEEKKRLVIDTQQEDPNITLEYLDKSIQETKKRIEKMDMSLNKRVIYSSFTDTILTYEYTKNNLINTILYAYNNHISLKLDPEDILTMISINISMYINDNAEKLRNKFVVHDGKKEINIDSAQTTLKNIDFNDAIKRLNIGIDKNIKVDLSSVLMPSFTTTTDVHICTVGAIMMSAYKKYFSYSISMLCGIKSIELGGTLDDWIMLKEKYTKLKTLMPELHMWYTNFDTIIENLLATKLFMVREESEESEYNRLVDFWATIVNKKHYGSGSTSISGWCQYLENNCKFSEDINEGQVNKIVARDPDDFLSSTCCCDIDIKGAIECPTETTIELVSGLIGITFVDKEHQIVKPVVGYYVMY